MKEPSFLLGASPYITPAKLPSDDLLLLYMILPPVIINVPDDEQVTAAPILGSKHPAIVPPWIVQVPETEIPFLPVDSFLYGL